MDSDEEYWTTRDYVYATDKKLHRQLDNTEQPDFAEVVKFLTIILDSLGPGGDFEVMHSHEDDAMRLLVRLVAKEIYEPAKLVELAKIVCEMNETPFTHWYA